MNLSSFHDAMGLIDDDLIEEADALRIKPKSITWIWIRRACLIAACVAIVIVGTTVVSNGFLFRGADCGSLVYDNYAEYVTSEDAETQPGSYTDSGSSIVEAPITLFITAWESNGFQATVVDAANEQDSITVGDTVSVVFAEDITALVENDNTVISFEEHVPSSADYPIGTTVSVWRNEIRITNNIIVLVAYRIAPYTN